MTTGTTLTKGVPEYDYLLQKFRLGKANGGYDVQNYNAAQIRAAEQWEDKFTNQKTFTTAVNRIASIARMEELEELRKMQPGIQMKAAARANEDSVATKTRATTQQFEKCEKKELVDSSLLTNIQDKGQELIHNDEHSVIYEYIVWKWEDQAGNQRLSAEIRLPSGQNVEPGNIRIKVLNPNTEVSTIVLYFLRSEALNDPDHLLDLYQNSVIPDSGGIKYSKASSLIVGYSGAVKKLVQHFDNAVNQFSVMRIRVPGIEEELCAEFVPKKIHTGVSQPINYDEIVMDAREKQKRIADTYMTIEDAFEAGLDCGTTAGYKIGLKTTRFLLCHFMCRRATFDKERYTTLLTVEEDEDNFQGFTSPATKFKTSGLKKSPTRGGSKTTSHTQYAGARTRAQAREAEAERLKLEEELKKRNEESINSSRELLASQMKNNEKNEQIGHLTESLAAQEQKYQRDMAASNFQVEELTRKLQQLEAMHQDSLFRSRQKEQHLNHVAAELQQDKGNFERQVASVSKSYQKKYQKLQEMEAELDKELPRKVNFGKPNVVTVVNDDDDDHQQTFGEIEDLGGEF